MSESTSRAAWRRRLARLVLGPRTMAVAHALEETHPLAPAASIASAAMAGLRYIAEEEPGIRRVGSGRGFRYVAPGGAPVRDRATLDRIRSLAIPPAWKNVWICPDPSGHIQATGRDARGRKQYRYHPSWRDVRDATKYDRMLSFAEALPKIRAAIERDLARPGLPREKVLATVVRLLEASRMRIGNEEYARANGSFGITTLRNRHVDVDGSTIRFHFQGKSGVRHRVDVHDRRLAPIIARCEELPGQRLFEYIDEDGGVRPIESQDVNDYLRRVAGGDFTAKDFRTWAGTILAARALRGFEPTTVVKHLQKNVLQAIRMVSAELGNTPAVCRRAYVHPAVIEAYRDGLLAAVRAGRVAEEIAITRVLRRAASEDEGRRTVRRLRASVKRARAGRSRPRR